MRTFNLSDIELTKYLFFTGKGGVGKTSIACATAVGLQIMVRKYFLSAQPRLQTCKMSLIKL